MPAVSSVYEFGPFQLDAAERLLMRAGQQIALTPKAFDVLLYMVERHGRLLPKQELMSAIWADTYVEEANLTYTVSALRKALADGQNGEQYIQTVPTRGYRFVAPVTHGDGRVSPTPDTTRTTRPVVRRVMTVGLAVVLSAMLVDVVGHLRETTTTGAPARFTIPLPDSSLATSSVPMSQISPDGKRVALCVGVGSPVSIRDIDGESTVPIRGTEGARALFWAPDSEQLAFSTSSALKKVSLSDGAVEILCDTCQPTGGGTWSRDGLIVFTTVQGSLFSIPAAGGTPLGSTDARLILEGDLPAIYAMPGYLLFLQAGVVMGQRFDPVRLTLTGHASPLLAAADHALMGQPAFSASETGVLTYAIVQRPVSQFEWVSRAGQLQDLVGEPGAYYTFDLSADARRLVFARFEASNASLWIVDLDRAVTSRLTFGVGVHADPRWTADASHVVATRWRPHPQSIVTISPNGVESTIAVPGSGNMVDDVSQDGATLLYRRGRQLLALSFRERSKPVVVRTALEGTINQAQFSPDSRWVAYQTNESGRFEVRMPRHLVLALLVGAVVLAAVQPAPAQRPAPRLNVLLIMADDVNTDIGTYGHPLVKTPQPRSSGVARRALQTIVPISAG